MKGLIVCLLFTGILNAQSPAKNEKVFTYPDFRECGLITRYSSNKIPPSCLTEAKNVLFDEDLSVSRREGYAKYNATPCEDQKSIRGLWRFSAIDGTKYLVIASSTSLFYTKGTGDCTKIEGLNLSSVNDLDCVQFDGALWCTNGVDSGFYWDGTSTATVSDMPLATKIDVFKNRLIAADIAGQKSRVLLSGYGNGTDWTLKIPGKSTSPASISISGLNDGDAVTCLMGEYNGAYFIGRENDIWALYGNDRRDFRLAQVSKEVGCLEDTSVKEKNNCLVWLSKRGVEKLCGTTINRISDGVRSIIDEVITSKGNSRTKTYDSQEEWEAGEANGEWTSTTIYPGSVVPSTWSTTVIESYQFDDGNYDNTMSSSVFIDDELHLEYEDFYNNTYLSNPRWYFNNMTADASSGSLELTKDAQGYAYTVFTTKYDEVDGFQFDIYHGDSDDIRVGIYGMDNLWVRLQTGESAKLQYGSDSSPTTICDGVTLPTDCGWNRYKVIKNGTSLTLQKLNMIDNSVVSSCSGTRSDSSSDISQFRIYRYSTNTNSSCNTKVDNIYGIYKSTGEYISKIFDTGLSTTVIKNFNIDFSTYNGLTDIHFFIRESTSPNNDEWSTWNDYDISTNTIAINSTKRYIQIKFLLVSSDTAHTPLINSFNIQAVTTGYYIPDCVEATNITSWGNFRPADYTDGNASISYYVSTGSTCNEVTRATATWNSQIPNSVIAVDTAPYLGVKAVLNPTSSTETLRLNALTIEWNEGEARPPVTAEVYRDRYYLFYTTNTLSTAYNDHALVLDSNDKWSLFDNIYVSAAREFEKEFYIGDSRDTGYLYKMLSGHSDDTDNFEFKIQTSDYDFGEPAQNKILKRVYLLLKSEEITGQNINLTVKYYIDGSTTAYSLNSVNLDEAEEHGYFVAKFPVPLSQPSTFRWLSLSIDYTGDQGPLNIYGIKVIYVPLDWD